MKRVSSIHSGVTSPPLLAVGCGVGLLLLLSCAGSPPEPSPPQTSPTSQASLVATGAPESSSSAEPTGATSSAASASGAGATGALGGASTVQEHAAPLPPPPRCPEGMALVPGGEFQQSGRQAPVTIVDMCFDVLETTVTEYSACIDEGMCTKNGLDCSAQSTYGREGKAAHPIVCIDFDQASAYCASKGKRLPSVVEWEWAARGGDEGLTYPWGNEDPDEQVCWTGKKRQAETCPVGTFVAGKSKHGILNMGGNVLEFTTTEADERSPVRIAKGGAWNGGDPGLFKNSRLGGFKKEYRCGFLGVRCARVAAPAESSSASTSTPTPTAQPTLAPSGPAQ